MEELIAQAPRSDEIEGSQAMDTPEDVQAMLKLARVVISGTRYPLPGDTARARHKLAAARGFQAQMSFILRQLKQ